VISFAKHLLPNWSLARPGKAVINGALVSVSRQIIARGIRRYLLPTAWLRSWKSYVGEKQRNSFFSSTPAPNPSSFPGPINLSSLQSTKAATNLDWTCLPQHCAFAYCACTLCAWRLIRFDLTPIARLASGKVQLMEYLMEGQHYDLIPQAAWDLFVSWYSLAPDSEPLARKVIGPSVAPMVSFALASLLSAHSFLKCCFFLFSGGNHVVPLEDRCP
jgi:hypothetical protein